MFKSFTIRKDWLSGKTFNNYYFILHLRLRHKWHSLGKKNFKLELTSPESKPLLSSSLTSSRHVRFPFHRYYFHLFSRHLLQKFHLSCELFRCLPLSYGTLCFYYIIVYITGLFLGEVWIRLSRLQLESKVIAYYPMFLK